MRVQAIEEVGTFAPMYRPLCNLLSPLKKRSACFTWWHRTDEQQSK